MNSTRDLYLAATWLSLGAKHEGTDKSDPRHMEFKFSPKVLFETGILAETPVSVQDLEAIETAYVNGCVMVNAVTFKEALQRLKATIHSK